MRIYIAASWKHQHAVSMLTERLETMGHEIFSWLREGRPEEAFLSKRELAGFINSAEGRRIFTFCVTSATTADLVVYLGPSGCDAWAEVGAAHGAGVPVLGLLAKAEDVGLMRHMVDTWFSSVSDLLQAVSERSEEDHDAWTRAKVLEVLENPGETFTHQEVMAGAKDIIDRKRNA